MKKIIILMFVFGFFIMNSKAVLFVDLQVLSEEIKEFILVEDYYEVEFNTEYEIDDNDFLFIGALADLEYEKKDVDVAIISGFSNGVFFEDAINLMDVEYDLSVLNSNNFEFNNYTVIFRGTILKIVSQGQHFESVKIRLHRDYYTPYRVYSQELLNNDNINKDDMIGVFVSYNPTDAEKYDKAAPQFVGNTNIYTDIASPISLDDILKGIKAIDEYSGDVSDRIKVISSNYNSALVGDYKIELEVEDYFQNKSTQVLNVHVVDFYPPEITGRNYYEVGIVKYVTIDEIINNLIITDNSNLEITLNIIDNYTNYKNEIGEYNVIVEAIDSVYNKSSYEIIIKVTDDMPPSITGRDIKAYMSENKTIEEFKQFTYSDNTTSKEELVVSYDTDFNPLKKGEYYIKCEVSDELGNKSDLTVIIYLYDDVLPEFVSNEKIVSNYLSKDEIYKYFNVA